MLYNKTLKAPIHRQTVMADSFFKRLKGLMFSKEFDFALIFPFQLESRVGASIHMLFVFTPIDVVYLNKGKKVVDLKESLQPWTLNYTPKQAAKYLIELPAGLIKKKGIKLGHLLDWNQR
jgi:uncharacterized membrane protein (UPF0127 family)